MSKKPYRAFNVLEVKQPFGNFYLISISAEDLLELSFTDPLRYDGEELKGTQRKLDEEKRVKEIKEYVEGYEAAFPNSIIISANYDENGLNCQSEELRWRIEDNKLIIPTNIKLASIIDGQHRVFGFKNANQTAREMQLACSVYLDLPNAYQAYLFATINSNQKPVDKSLAYMQFGFNLEKEPPQTWSPDKLAIALYKKFESEQGSPFYNHVKIAPQADEALLKEMKSQKWLISTATIVDGLLRLISTNPKRDKYILQKLPSRDRSRSILPTDSSPLREIYKLNEDGIIYKIVYNYFKAAEVILFNNADQSSAIIKTVGIQGLFDALRRIILIEKETKPLTEIDFSQSKFESIFANISTVNFKDNFYQFSSVGKTNITETILLLNDYIKTPEINEDLDPKEKEQRMRKAQQHNKIKELVTV